MRRFNSYGEDLEEVVRKDWPRREVDKDRTASHHRAYPRAEKLWKASSSSPRNRSIDDDWEPIRPPRKRIEHESDGFDRRKTFDRYRDGGGGSVDRDRSMHASSPRSSHGSERMYRSESLSCLRKGFPKGLDQKGIGLGGKLAGVLRGGD
ncbi:hypothetical protein HPP92_019948 [Vanilla planifolia]|uniref:Uncharacterized protein n=1 Tax=Vanilla planifolia TaxID=51239 RepID=A0A835Q505_VANPL|nr:hypothetical protein HPP92_019948 [Vanilla planifolia]